MTDQNETAQPADAIQIDLTPIEAVLITASKIAAIAAQGIAAAKAGHLHPNGVYQDHKGRVISGPSVSQRKDLVAMVVPIALLYELHIALGTTVGTPEGAALAEKTQHLISTHVPGGNG